MLLLFLSPLFFAMLLLFLPKQVWDKPWFQPCPFLLSLIPLLALLLGGSSWIGSEVNVPWFPTLGISFFLKIDSLSLLFLYLTALVIPLALLAANHEEKHNARSFCFFVLLLESLLIGFFTARDLAFFTIFWEATLLPLFFLIQLFGKTEKYATAMKFLIYMIAGSALLVAAVFALFFAAGSGSFLFDALQGSAEKGPYAAFIFAAFLLAFAVKTPLFPFHAWLPDVYTNASTSQTILLSALLSKAGIYGFLRVALGLFPLTMLTFSPYLLVLAIAGVLFGALAAWRQDDFKRLIAYSSLSHVNFILAALFVGNTLATRGGTLQAFNHGVTITGLFLVSAWLEERLQSRSILKAGGLARYLPKLAWLTFVFILASVALPGTNNFIGEFLSFFGLFTKNPWAALILGFSIVLSVIYMLRLMQKVYFEIPMQKDAFWLDIGKRELAMAAPLVLLIFFIGLYPQPFLDLAKPLTDLGMSR